VSEYQLEVCLPTGLSELLSDIFQCINRALLVPASCLIWVRLLGDDVIAENGDAHRSE
jgi:hypothetical protein